MHLYRLKKLSDIFRENSRKVITPTRYLPWKMKIIVDDFIW